MGESMFPLGEVVITPGARDAMYGFKCANYLLKRHSFGDWGQVSDEDKAANDAAVKEGGRILSAYELPSKVLVWVITEGDRSQTTILRPEEY